MNLLDTSHDAMSPALPLSAGRWEVGVGGSADQGCGDSLQPFQSLVRFPGEDKCN